MILKLRNLFLLFLALGIFQFTHAQEPWSLQKCVDYALENNIQIKQSKINTEYNNYLLLQKKLIYDYNIIILLYIIININIKKYS